MEIHKVEKKYCTVEGCPKFFYASHYLFDHIRRQHKAAYQCENILSGCTFTTRSGQTLKEHENLSAHINLACQMSVV